ncbi:MAG: hypothetical protein QW478_09725, partial [Candidatus Micrarchaeaceae archaeon]
TIEPVVTVSPQSISGATTSTFTLNGYGFPADDSFAASTVSNPQPTITVGGIEALNPAFTSSSSGSFTVTVTGLVSAIKTYAPADISLTDTSGSSYSDVGSIIVSVPNPSALGFEFSVTPTISDVYNVNDSVLIEVWDFPASQNVQFYLGSFLVGSLTTDSNGAGVLSTVVPPVPGGMYTPIAVVSSSHLTTEPTTGTSSYTISPYFEAVDPTGTPLLEATPTTGEYVPSNGLITVKAYGLNPALNSYDVYDSIVAPLSNGVGVYYSGLVTSISVGTGTTNLMQPAPNGTLIFTYSPDYSSVAPTTGTPGVITFNKASVSGYAGNSYAYYAIGSVDIKSPSELSIIASGSGNSLLISSSSGLIPYTAALYPGVENSYNAYIGSTELTLQFTNQEGAVVTGTVFNSLDSGITFTAPSVTGLFNLSITYNGQSLASAPGVEPVVISSSGSSPSSGSLVLVPTKEGYDVVGFGYDQAVSSVKFYYMSYGAAVSSGTTESLQDGAFVDTLTLSSIFTSYPEPAGTYAVFTVAVSSGVNYYVYSSYSVTTSLTLANTVSGTATGAVGESVTATPTGLIPTSYYNLYFGTEFMTAFLGDGPATFTVPTVPAGTYNVTVVPIGSTTPVATAQFTVSAPSFTLSTDAPYAFPGELVSFAWKPSSPPKTGSGYGPVQVTVFLNGTAFTTVAATVTSDGTLLGSFQMPNAAVGSYWDVTLGYSQIVYSTTTSTTTTSQPFSDPASSTETVSTSPESFTSSESAAIAEFFFPASTATSLTATDYLEFQINFAGDVFTSALTEITGTGTYSGSGLSTDSYSVSWTVYVTSFTAGTTDSTPGTITFYVTGMYNDQPFTSETVTLNTDGGEGGSAATTYYSTIGLPGSFDVTTITTTSDITTSTHTSSYGSYLGLVSGGGALVVNISASSIATLTVHVSNAVTASLEVPLSELNATLVAINGTVAKLSTAFGNMTASLKAINATIAGIANGQMIINTTLGKITTSLSSLNASIVSLSGNVAVINTTLGQVTASLKAINATVSSIMNGQAVIETTLGKITASLSSINASIVAISHNVVVINTTLGQVTASLTAINGTVSSIANGQMIINTTLGKITTSLSSLNASIVSLSGNVAVINTTLGQVTASLKAINATVSSIMNGQAVIETTLGKITASLSSINASIVAISHNVVVINTTLGQVTASLSAINATVASIMNGQVIMQTDLGSIQTSLASLNASIVSLSHNVVVINTTLGQVTASLKAINATVSSIMNGQAVIETTLGKITASLSTINATLTGIQGGMAKVQTDLGTISTSLSSINASIAAVHGNTVEISTSLGMVNTTLNAINATVTSSASGISSLKGSSVTIINDLGSINGTVVSISGNVATIKTSVGNLTTNVSAIKTTAQTIKTNTQAITPLEIFLIVI